MIIGGTDLETTGFLEPEHRIIEVCISRYDFDPATFTAKHLDTWTQRIDPKRSIDKKAQDVHKITANDLIGKPTWDVVGPDAAKRLDTCDVVVGHNFLEFDAPFLIQEWERIKCPLPDFIPFDTMQDGRWATPMGTVPNLGALCFACGVPYDHATAHAADYDVGVMMECFFFGLRRGVFTLKV